LDISEHIPRRVVRDIIQWDVLSWAKILGYWDKAIDWNGVNNCLELGGRQGGLALWLTLKGKEVICSDLYNCFPNSQKQAEILHKKYQVHNSITYQDIDAANIPYENYFDVIVFKSMIGGIGSNNNIAIQKKVFEEIYKALKPGGKLLFAENLIGSPLHQFARKKFVKWGTIWRYVSLNEIEQFLSSYKKYDIKSTGMTAAFGRTEWQRNLLAVFDKLFFNHICPDNWKYICFGIAEK
jgi:SAM-dependent methyltransferase